jgi:hypothetical protein
MTRQNRFYIPPVLLTCASILTLLSCSFGSPSSTREFLADGSLMISRSLPPPAAPQNTTTLGLLPTYGAHTGTWLLIDTGARTASLMEGDTATVVAPAEGTDTVRPGRFQLLHKQRNPLWYAPPSYFQQRQLPVPPEGDRARFRRGALGDFVLYITKEIPVHSGPVWTDDVGGIRLDDTSLSKMYYMLPVGAPIEIH